MEEKLNTDSDEILIIVLYKCAYGHAPGCIEKLAGAGSSRKYYRVYKGSAYIDAYSDGIDTPSDGADASNAEDIVHEPPESLIATIGDNLTENKAFVDLANYFAQVNAETRSFVPQIFAVSEDYRVYFQEDFGNECLLDRFSHYRNMHPNVEEALAGILNRVAEALVVLQFPGNDDWKESVFNKKFDSRQVLWDLNYFKYDFLKIAGIECDESALQDDFELLATKVEEANRLLTGFMMRDCQSRNIMISKGSALKFIDFQGGREGFPLYDIISLLWQARAALPASVRNGVLEYYCDLLETRTGVRASQLLKYSGLFRILRGLQVMGAYGLRGLVERKPHFVESIRAGIENLKEMASEGLFHDYPEISNAVGKLAGDSRWDTAASLSAKGATDSRLRVEVFSFSYKKGYPADESGNGGGFMFDCRGMHNPGRYEEYRSLTGMDKPVRDFLEDRGEVQGFVDKAFEIVKPSVETYIRRGFTNLQVGFGCTGGQHRSAYCAGAFAEKLHHAFPGIDVVLNHREQNVKKYFSHEINPNT